MAKTFEAVYEDGVLRPLESLALSNRQRLLVTIAEAPATASDARGFFEARTIDQLIAEQGILPVSDIGVFAGAIPDEDVDAFVADIYSDRLV
jgi:predicted DNA-binding antitoxin AbrB/MazE fold protein